MLVGASTTRGCSKLPGELLYRGSAVEFVTDVLCNLAVSIRPGATKTEEEGLEEVNEGFGPPEPILSAPNSPTASRPTSPTASSTTKKKDDFSWRFHESGGGGGVPTVGYYIPARKFSPAKNCPKKQKPMGIDCYSLGRLLFNIHREDRGVKSSVKDKKIAAESAKQVKE